MVHIEGWREEGKATGIRAIDVKRKWMDSRCEVCYEMEKKLGANPKSDGCTIPCVSECRGFEERECETIEIRNKWMWPCVFFPKGKE